ncbi:MAG: histidine kinase [Anaerolineales bacterium]
MKNDREGEIPQNSSTTKSSRSSSEAKPNLNMEHPIEDLFHKAIDCLPCHAAIVDHNGKIIAVNKLWRNMTKDIRDEEKQATVGMNYLDICEGVEGPFPSGGKPFGKGLQAVLNRQIERFEMEYPSKDIEQYQWFLGRAIGLEINGNRYAFTLHEDISEHKYREIQCLSLHSQIPTLLDTVKSVVSKLDLNELLNVILKKLEQLIRNNASAIFTYDVDTIILQAYHGPSLSNLSPIFLLPKGRYPEIQRIVDNKHSFFISNINEIPSLLVEISEMLKLNLDNLKRFHSWLFLPMVVNENQIGIMVLTYHENGCYDHADLSIGQLFANYAAIAIQNANLYKISQNTGILKERNRLACELHDSIAQSLFSINLYANAIKNALEIKKFTTASDYLHELQKLSGDAVKDMRLMIFELNDQLLDEFGIVNAIKARFEAIEAKQGIQADLIVQGELELPNLIESEVYGIIQELLNYLEKTIQSKNIKFYINAEDNQIIFRILTDNVIDPQEDRLNADSDRLNRIRSRIHRIGGRLRFEKSTDHNSEINFVLDL